MIDPITFWYGIACAAVLIFTGRGRRANLGAFLCAIMLLAAYVATNLLNALVPYPDCFKPYAPINLICGAYASYWLLKRPQIWSLALALSFLIMTGLDTEFAISGGYENYGLVHDYMARENLLFSAQLFLVCIPGIGDVLGRLVRYLLPDPRWHSLQRLAFWRAGRTTKEG